MKATFHLGWVTAASLLAVNTAGEGTLAVSSGSPSRQILLSVPVADRLATQEPRAPDLASALWVVTPLPITVPARYGYYGTARSLNDRGDVLGNDLSQMKHVSSGGVVTDLGIYRFHYNSGRQLDNSGRLALNAAVGSDGLLLQLRDGLPPTETRFTDTRLTSVDNEGGLLGVALNLSRLTDQDYWGQHFLQRGSSRRDLPAPADSGFGADFVTLNERDEVAGSAYQIPREWWRGLYLKPGNEPRWLPGFGAYEEVYNMNTHGQIVGSSSVPAGFGYAPGMYPAFWENGGVGRIAILDTDRSLFGGEYGWAWAINRWGHVVGRTRSGGKLWLNGRPHDLTGKVINLENVRLDYFSDINDKGEIIGAEYAIGGTQGSRAFIMRPIWPSLAVDLNRDGIISLPSDGDKSDLTTPAMPYRLWVNDDDDDNDISTTGPTLIGNSDDPGPSSFWGQHAGRTPDRVNPGVDGRSDLLDFFPVFLDIKQLLGLLPHDGSIEYKLKQDDDALNFVYANLTRAEAFDYLYVSRERAAYGPTGSVTQAHIADTEQITSAGVVLNSFFLDRIKTEAEKGVILIEGRAATSAPMRLVVEKDGVGIAEVVVNINISPVEDMFRWVNLRSICGQSETRPTDLSEPTGYPDSATNGKMFVWVHGYNVNERQSRAWFSEAFKRMYQSGSRAMFTGVSWHGDKSQVPILGFAPDYWDNIPFSFRTGEALAPIVNNLPGSSKTIAGHSMGNVVVSSAIVDHGMNVARYFMVNAAVALEAYDTSVSTTGPYYVNAMRPIPWANFERRLWPTDWWKLFPEGDNRRRLTWMNRFGNIPHAINVYSSGEEVLNNNDATPGELPYYALPFGPERVWIQQEMSKGGGSAAGTLAGALNGEIQGGWGFNSLWDNKEWVPDDSDAGGYFRYWPKTPAEASALTDEQLRAQPFFGRFTQSELMNATLGAGSSGSNAANEATRANLLGGAIPALSFPAGRNPVPLFENRNRDMVQLQDGWPASRLADPDGRLPNVFPYKGRWFHSDIKNIAYPFNRAVWDFFTNEGNLR